MITNTYTRALAGLVLAAAFVAVFFGASLVRAENAESLMLRSASQQYISSNNPDNYSSSAITIESWIKVLSLADSAAMIVQQGDSLNDGSFTFTLKQFGSNDYRLWGQVEETADNVHASITEGSTNFYDLRGQWVHVAMSWSAGQPVKLYVNGVEETNNAQEIVDAASLRQASPIRVGAQLYNGQLGMYFDGMIDEVRIWNSARSESEIVSDKNSELSGAETGLATYLQFNGTFDSTAVGATGWQPINGADFSNDIPFEQLGVGKSAYELALDNGFVGNVTQWLASLVGAQGQQGLHGGNANSRSASFASSTLSYLSLSTADAETQNLNITNDFTIEAWAKFNTIPVETHKMLLVSKSRWGTGPDRSYLFGIYRNSGQTAIFGEFNSSANVAGGEWNPELGRWYHLAIVGEGGGTYVIYVDGVPYITETGKQDLSAVSGQDLLIGGHNLDGSVVDAFDGTIDEVRIWDVARTQDEIQADMSREVSGQETGLKGYWQFDGNFKSPISSGAALTPHGVSTFSTDIPFTSGAQGVPGPQGPAGLLSGSQMVAGATTTIAANAAVGTLSPVATVQCPSGKILLGGGARVQHPGAARGAVSISEPNGSNGWNARGVVVLQANSLINVVPFAVCSQ